ncbi:hypothetical protein JCM8547_001230 [Rhodosporidiobolus lusitaniae]
MHLTSLAFVAAAFGTLASAAPTFSPSLVKRDGEQAPKLTETGSQLAAPLVGANISITGGGYLQRLDAANFTFSYQASVGESGPTSVGITSVSVGLQGPTETGIHRNNPNWSNWQPWGVLQARLLAKGLTPGPGNWINATLTIPLGALSTRLGEDGAGEYYLIVTEHQVDTHITDGFWDVQTFNTTVNLGYFDGGHLSSSYPSA